MKGRKEREMKKTLAILLSLALVVCMIPATASVAFGAMASVNTQIDGVNYQVTISENTFTYDGTPKGPKVTVKGADTQSVVPANITFGKNGEADSDVKPTNSGSYNIYVQPTGSSSKEKVALFDIQPVQLANVDVEKRVDITAENITTIADAGEGELKNTYFRVSHGGKDIPTNDYTLNAEKDTSGKKLNVTVSAKGTGNVTGNAVTKEFSVVQSLASGYTVSKAKGEFIYTGSRMAPQLVVQKSGEAPLTYGTDYTVSCGDGINAGTRVQVTVTGRGDYKDSLTETFEIEKRPIGTPYITPAMPTAVQGDSTVDFNVEVAGRTLKRGTDYQLEGFSAKDVTENAKVKIRGIGNYEGSYDVTFKVVAAGSKDLTVATLTLDRTQLTYNGSAQAPTETVKIGSSRLSQTAYTIKYKLHGSSAAASTAKPKDCGIYDVIIENKSGYSGSKTFESAFEIKPLDINSSSITASYIGTPYDNPVKLTLGSKTLYVGTDYDVDYYSAYKTYYTVTGKGNFTGTRTVYTSTKNISYCTATFSDNRTSVSYGQKYYPKVTVYDGSKKLVEGTDYKLTYKNSKKQEVSYCQDTGSYTVVITGINAYTGTRELTFTINGTDISKYTVTLKYASVNATGSVQTPEILSVKYGISSSLTANDYIVSYQDSNGKTVDAKNLIAPGTYKVIVTGRNGYKGSTSTTFRIVGLSQTVTVSQDSYKVYATSDYFRIDARATGEYSGFTYTSSNPAVASVSSAGYVTPKKVGRAVITVTAVGKNRYESASKRVEVKIYPSKVKLSNKPWTAGKKAQLKVRWGYQDGVTKYQVRYSRDKNFKAGTYLTKTVKAHGKDYTTQSTTLTKLKRGYTYYVKVRAVYTDPVTGDNYYGSWSGWRSAKTI